MYERGELYRGDGPSGLGALSGVDLVLTDPPYGTKLPYRRLMALWGVSMGTHQGELPEATPIRGDDDVPGLMERFALASAIAAAPDAWAAVFASPKSLPVTMAAMGHVGWRFRSLFVWDKKTPSVNAGIKRRYELIALFRLGKPRYDYIGPDIVRYTVARNRVHVAQKPADLLRDLVRWFCPPGGLVADPFAGSGSTVAAAVSVGRRAVGFEIDDMPAVPFLPEPAQDDWSWASTEGHRDPALPPTWMTKKRLTTLRGDTDEG